MVINKQDDKTLVWDQQALEKRVRGKQDRMVKLIKLFLQDMPPRMESLASQINDAHLEETQEIAHTIKGVSGNLSVMRLQSVACNLEAAARAEEAGQIRLLLPELMIAYEKSEQVLRQFVARAN